MRPRKHGFLALGLSVCLLSLVAKVTTEQAPVQTQQASPDGLVHSQLSLGGHAVTVAFVPALKADDAANRVFRENADPHTSYGRAKLPS